MITWNEIITMAATPEQRLNELFGVWQDILGTYRDPQMMYFDSESFLAIVESNYNRFLYPSNTASILKNGEVNNRPEADKNIRLLTEDDRNYRLVKALAKIFNCTLSKEQREMIARTYFFHESRFAICEKCSITKTTYYKIRQEARIKLIMKYCLDHYDDYGIEKHNWLDVSKERRKWNNGHFFKDDIHDWPGFNNELKGIS